MGDEELIHRERNLGGTVINGWKEEVADICASLISEDAVQKECCHSGIAKEKERREYDGSIALR